MRREFLDDNAGRAEELAIIVRDKTARQLVLVEAGGEANDAAFNRRSGIGASKGFV